MSHRSGRVAPRQRSPHPAIVETTLHDGDVVPAAELERGLVLDADRVEAVARVQGRDATFFAVIRARIEWWPNPPARRISSERIKLPSPAPRRPRST